ncbi:MAG: hypothetical protein HQK54_17060 [Oligoflexales bacterium]|nr:hypothetical protein [Oligoflexales bacterium]
MNNLSRIYNRSYASFACQDTSLALKAPATNYLGGLASALIVSGRNLIGHAGKLIKPDRECWTGFTCVSEANLARRSHADHPDGGHCFLRCLSNVTFMRRLKSTSFEDALRNAEGKYEFRETGISSGSSASQSDRQETVRELLYALSRNDPPSSVRPMAACRLDGVSADELLNRFTKNDHKKIVGIERDILSKSSGGVSQDAWVFTEKSLNLFFKNMFRKIEAASLEAGIVLSEEDLFHGHVFSFENGKTADIGIVFHAKEYPRDLAINTGHGENSPFTTSDRSYELRNVIWLMSSGKLWMVDSGKMSGPMKSLMLAEGTDPESDDPFMKEYASLQIKANTLQDVYFSDAGKSLGAVNFFIGPDGGELFFFR